jgi:hypothetical protein
VLAVEAHRFALADQLALEGRRSRRGEDVREQPVALWERFHVGGLDEVVNE